MTTLKFYYSLSPEQKIKVDEVVSVRWDGILKDSATNTLPSELDVLRENVAKELYRIIQG
jgi:hypothetical protein